MLNDMSSENVANCTTEEITTLKFEPKADSREYFICAVLMMRQEEKTVQRMLDSLKDNIDAIVFMDTGSTDNTVDVVTKYCENNGLRFALFHDEWINDFGRSRTKSVEYARQAFPESTHFLMTDADNEWVFEKKLKDIDLPHSGSFDIYTPTIHNLNLRLLSARLDWKCMMRTHEQWIYNFGEDLFPAREGIVSGVHIVDHADGGYKAVKFERDEKALELDVEEFEHANNKREWYERAMFYLVRTKHALGKHLEVVELGQKANLVLRNTEELYCNMRTTANSHITLAKNILYKILDYTKLEDICREYAPDTPPDLLYEKAVYHITQAVNLCLLAFYVSGARAESLHDALEIFEDIGLYEHLYRLCKLARHISVPEKVGGFRHLFVEPSKYGDRFLLGSSIACWYTGRYEKGKEICKYLMEKESPFSGRAALNLAHYP